MSSFLIYKFAFKQLLKTADEKNRLQICLTEDKNMEISNDLTNHINKSFTWIFGLIVWEVKFLILKTPNKFTT